MNITLKENLKMLRNNKGNTQEELATHLGISIPAVSKWERGEGYPDITLLPCIANYYNVSVDDLLGVGQIKKEERIAEILSLEQENSNKGKTVANVNLLKEAYKEFPNNWRISKKLMYAYCIYNDLKYDS